MKLLILAIYTEDEFLTAMMNQTNEYLHALAAHPRYHDQFAYYFIIYKSLPGCGDGEPTQPMKEFEIDHDRHILYINGTDSVIPGIMHKTLDAIDILTNRMGMKYDYIMRTTTATCIHIPKMLYMLQQLPPDQRIYMGNIVTLNWFDVPYGIVDQTHWGTQYCGGNFAIFNGKIGSDMVDARDFFVPYEQIVDDVLIGIYVKNANASTLDIKYINCIDMINKTGMWNPEYVVSFHNSNKEHRIVDVLNHQSVTKGLIGELQSIVQPTV